MARVYTSKNSRNWHAVLRDGTGRRALRSTRIPVGQGSKVALERSRAEALEVAKKMERVWSSRADGLTLEELFERFAAQVAEERDGGDRPDHVRPVLGILAEWMGGWSCRADKVTASKARQFTALLPVRADGKGLGYSPSTARNYLTALKWIFRIASQEGWVGDDPFAAVQVPRARKATKALHDREKEAFTADEVRLLLQTAPSEWRVPILLGATAGARLGDATSLRWEQVDLASGTMGWVVEKTGEEISLPIAPALRTELEKTPAEERTGPISPLAGRPRSSLCRAFRKLMDRAGVSYALREGKHSTPSKGFHSLRHFAVTALAANSVDAKTRMAITGHRSARVHSSYDHNRVEMEAMVKAVDAVRLEG
jgi:integrase